MKTKAGLGSDSSKVGHCITVYDVACHVGVSPSTVSRTFSCPKRVSIPTARNVQQVADTLGCHIEIVNILLGTHGRCLVAVIVRDLGNQFFNGIIRNIPDECERFRFKILILETMESITKERFIVYTVSVIILISPGCQTL